MKRIFSILALSCAFFSMSLFAQTAQESSENEQDLIVYEMNQVGDQYIGFKLNLDIPYSPFRTLQVGGSGSLGYHRFITEEITLGGNISFNYNQTIGDNVFYFVPFMFSAGYQFEYNQFEFPVSLEIGGAIQSYLDRTYFGLAIRPEAGAYYRLNPDWSFGMTMGLYILPQWYSNPEYNYTGVIHEIGLAARYHF